MLVKKGIGKFIKKRKTIVVRIGLKMQRDNPQRTEDKKVVGICGGRYQPFRRIIIKHISG